jgi:hypothetical protein
MMSRQTHALAKVDELRPVETLGNCTTHWCNNCLGLNLSALSSLFEYYLASHDLPAVQMQRPINFAPRHFYHLAEPTNLPSIRRYGLLSTERLLELANLPERQREAILSQHRPESVELANGVIIRDQKPMPPHLIARALPKDVSPAAWYRFLNRFVFLWSNRARVERHLRALAGKPQILLTFDASQLLEQLGERIYLSPINSGNARRRPVPRSTLIFVPYREWIESGWRPAIGDGRRRSSPPAEILVEADLTLEPFLVSACMVQYGSTTKPCK